MKIFPCILAAALASLKVRAITPDARYGGDSILLNRRLYYYGGRASTGSNTTTLQDLVYIDITKNFDVSTAQSNWQQVQATGDLTPEPNYLYAMAVIPELNSILLYGGAGYNSETQLLQHSVVVYNATTNTWESLIEPQPRLKQVFVGTASRGDDGKAYVFGGRSYANVLPPFNNDIRIYDFATAAWSQGAALPANVGVRFRTPTTLAGKDLYYIGGMTANYTTTQVTSDNIMVPLSEILIYNIDDNKWRTAQATGDIPSTRIMHTIASKPNTQDILLYGGKPNISTNTPITAGNTCYILHTSSMTWEKKNPVGVGPGALFGHAVNPIISAVFADRSSLLFIMFGVNSTGDSQSRFHILNTENWTWDTSYLSSYPGQDDGSTDNGGSSNGVSAGTIAGAVVGSVVGVSLIAGALFFFLRRKRRNGKEEGFTGTGGNVTNFNDRSDGGIGGGLKPEESNDGIPNATLSPLLPTENVPPYRPQVPDEIDPPMALSVQNTNNAHSAPRPENIRPVKPDGE